MICNISSQVVSTPTQINSPICHISIQGSTTSVFLQSYGRGLDVDGIVEQLVLISFDYNATRGLRDDDAFNLVGLATDDDTLSNLVK